MVSSPAKGSCGLSNPPQPKAWWLSVLHSRVNQERVSVYLFVLPAWKVIALNSPSGWVVFAKGPRAPYFPSLSSPPHSHCRPRADGGQRHPQGFHRKFTGIKRNHLRSLSVCCFFFNIVSSVAFRYFFRGLTVSYYHRPHFFSKTCGDIVFKNNYFVIDHNMHKTVQKYFVMYWF